jgi:hypothetical protein
MENARTIDPERGQRDGICTRCGANAEWLFVDAEKTKVEVTCSDYGAFEMSRAEFGQTESEIIEPAERE